MELAYFFSRSFSSISAVSNLVCLPDPSCRLHPLQHNYWPLFLSIDSFLKHSSSVVVSNRESTCVRIDTNDRLTARISTEHCPSYSTYDQVNVNMPLSFHTVVRNILFSCRGPLANNPQCKDAMDTFLSLAVRPITTLFQITGYNRARQRDKYGHLLEELAALQEEVNYKIWYSFARHQGCTFFLKTLF